MCNTAIDLPVFLLLLSSARYAFSELLCHCSTEDCKLRNVTDCTAISYCYVEYSRPNPENGRFVVITRGCIDEANPLMCDRKLGNPLARAARGDRPIRPIDWPVLDCCRSSLCNQQNEPRDETHWAFIRKIRLHHMRPTSPEPTTDEPTPFPPIYLRHFAGQSNLGSARLADKQRQQQSYHFSSPSSLLNPTLHIALPITAVCILLAVVICLLFATRRYTFGTPKAEGTLRLPASHLESGNSGTAAVYNFYEESSTGCCNPSRQRSFESVSVTSRIDAAPTAYLYPTAVTSSLSSYARLPQLEDSNSCKSLIDNKP